MSNMRFEDYKITNQNGVLSTTEPKISLPHGLGQYIIEGCNKFSDKIFQICPYTSTSITFAEFKIQSLNLAAHLKHSYNIKPGDVIMTSMKNSLQNSLPPAAAFYLNAVISSLDPTLSARDCEYLIKLAEPKILIVDACVLSDIKLAVRAANIHPQIIVNYENQDQQSKIDKHEFQSLHELILPAQLTEKFEIALVNPMESMATILFSSGTTGMPKGICLNHCSTFYVGSLIHEVMGNPQVAMLCTTIYWISGLALFIGQFINGTTKLAMRGFDVQEFLTTCIKYKVEGTFLATSYLPKLYNAKDLVNKSSLKAILGGAVTASKGLFALMQKTFPQIYFNQCYGMTEFGGPCCAFTANYGNDFCKFPESTGPPLQGFELKIVDTETGNILGPNQRGEIYCRSKFCMMGYYKETKSAFESDGFLKSGDLGHYDENNFLYISGRSKDMFKYQSWHIVPAILEAVITEHEAVDEAIVFGIPHKEDGYLPAAAIKLFDNTDNNVTPDTIIKFVAEKVADRQKLRGGVYVLAEMPRTPTGKIQRNKVYETVQKLYNL